MDRKEKIKAITKELKEKCDGRVMLRENKGYPGLRIQNIFSYNIFFDTPTSTEKSLIQTILSEHEVVRVSNFIIVGGAYGYKFSFDIREEVKE